MNIIALISLLALMHPVEAIASVQSAVQERLQDVVPFAVAPGGGCPILAVVGEHAPDPSYAVSGAPYQLDWQYRQAERRSERCGGIHDSGSRSGCGAEWKAYIDKRCWDAIGLPT